MSTKTNFSKKKEQKPVVRNARVRTHGLHIHDYTHKNPLKRHLTFPERTARTGAAARAPSGEHIHTSVVVYTRLNRTTFRTEGKLKKVASVRRGLLARVTHPSSRRASSKLHARVYRFIPTIMAPMAEKTFNVDVDRCVMRVARARDRDRDRASAS